MLRTIVHAITDALMPFRVVSTHTIFPQYLGKGATVVDLGGNRGAFSYAVAQEFATRPCVVEADPSLAAELQQDGRLRVLNAAVASACQDVTLYRSRNSECASIQVTPDTDVLDPIVVRGADWTDIVNEFALEHVDLLKVDIEGAEVQLLVGLAGTQLNRISQITVEFHDEFGYYSREVTDRVTDRLQACGFVPITLWPGHTYDVVFLNRSRCPKAGQLAWRIKYISRPLLRIARGIRRVFAGRGAL